MTIRHYDPSQGMCFQGDVAIIPMPADILVSRLDEIVPIDGRLILQAGEVSGHHHAINLRARHFQAQPKISGDPLIATKDPALKKALGGAAKMTAAGTARMFRDPSAVNVMLERGILTRADLAIGCLIVESAPMLLSHEEHETIEIPPGSYVIGRQIESAGAEERIIAD